MHVHTRWSSRTNAIKPWSDTRHTSKSDSGNGTIRKALFNTIPHVFPNTSACAPYGVTLGMSQDFARFASAFLVVRTTTDFIGLLEIWYPLKISLEFQRFLCICAWYVPLRTFPDFVGPGSIYKEYPLRMSADFYEWRFCCKWVPLGISLDFKQLESILRQVPL